MVQTKPRCVHPIGCVPKKDSGKPCPITDCSRPRGISLNDHMKRDLESFRMNSIDSAVSLSTPYCFYSIVDIESAWCWILDFPPHHKLQGFRWMFGTHDSSQYNYYVDNRVCLGLSCTPFIFNWSLKLLFAWWLAVVFVLWLIIWMNFLSSEVARKNVSRGLSPLSICCIISDLRWVGAKSFLPPSTSPS